MRFAAIVLVATVLVACDAEIKTSFPEDSTDVVDSGVIVDSGSAVDVPGASIPDDTTTAPVDTTRRDTTARKDSVALLAARADSVKVWVHGARDSVQFQIDARTLARTQTISAITIESSIKDSLGRSKGVLSSEFTGLAGGKVYMRSAPHRFGNATVVQPATFRYEVRGAGLRTPRTLTGRRTQSGTAPLKWPVTKVATPTQTPPPTRRRTQSIDPTKTPPPTVPDSARAGRRR
jgi:hypothetical protein